MTRSKSESRSAAAWALAEAQHGLVTRGQLLALGFTHDAIDHRIARGRLHRFARGVYAVGLRRGTPHQRWMAAVLACGEGAVLSHRSAAAQWGIGEERRGCIDVSLRRGSNSRHPGIHARRRPSLPERDVSALDGIPLTTPARTLLDLATELGPIGLERAVNEADKHELIDPETLRANLDDFAGLPGAKVLRRLLDRQVFRLSDSDLEIRFRPISAAAGLPPPLSKTVINAFEVDFHWPDLGLVVETDGLRYHRTASAQARDRLRDQTQVAAGLTVLRFTHHQVKYEPAHVRLVLALTARRLQH